MVASDMTAVPPSVTERRTPIGGGAAAATAGFIDSGAEGTCATAAARAQGRVDATAAFAARRGLLEPCWRNIATQLLRMLPRPQSVDFMEAFILPYAVQAQCAFWGGPPELEAALRYWTRPGQVELRGGHPSSAQAVAESHLRALLKHWRANAPDGTQRGLVAPLVPLLGPLTQRQAQALLADWTIGQAERLAAALAMAVRQLARPATRHAASDAPSSAVIAPALGRARAVRPWTGPLDGELRRITGAQLHAALDAIRAELPDFELRPVIERRECSRSRYAPLVLWLD